MLATATAGRTRLSLADRFEVGDLMYVQVLHPSNFGEIYVSAHMEYKTQNDTWRPVPTANTPLGQAYTSGKYPGMRDYVLFANVQESTLRHVSFFLPYDAAGLPNGTYDRRYVIRLWDGNNQEVQNTALNEHQVEVQRNNSGRVIIRMVTAKACLAWVTQETSKEPASLPRGWPRPPRIAPGAPTPPEPPAPPAPTPLKPEPMYETPGFTFFFDAKTGKLTCPR